MKSKSDHKPAASILIGISSCLLGEKVSYDGGHKKNLFVIDQLSPLFEFVPYCPEVSIGMGVPRPPIQLVDCDGEIHALGIKNPDMDMSEALREYGKSIHSEIACLSGYIFKCNSPSCGISNVKVLTKNNTFEFRGQGLFAAEVRQQRYNLPFIDEESFMHAKLRNDFLFNVHNYFRTYHQ